MSTRALTNTVRTLVCWLGCILLPGYSGFAQSVDWQSAVWREPQVRYLLCDISLGGNLQMYRDYAERENDPDSREAIRIWDIGGRVVNTNQFERRWVNNRLGKNGQVMRVVFRSTNRTITGNEVLLSLDGDFDGSTVRAILLDLSLGADLKSYQAETPPNPNAREACRRWQAGARSINAELFERAGADPVPHFRYRATGKPADLARIMLNTDLPYPENNVRYFMADIALGGSLEFYRTAAERAHEMGCLEAVRRTEDGYRILNLDQFERKQVQGQTLITRRGSDKKISGSEIRLSSDGIPFPQARPQR